MVDSDYEVIHRLVADRSRRLRGDITGLPPGANAPFIELLVAVLDRIDEECVSLPEDYRRDRPAELRLLLREMDRLAIDLNSVHWLLATYAADLNRRLPVGLTHLV